MTIDGTDIAAFGLRQSYVDGVLNAPARKQTVNPQTHTAKDIVYEERVVTATLVAVYSDPADAGIMIGELTTFLRQNQVHTFIFSNLGMSYKGVLKSGFKTQIFPYGHALEITMPITLTEF